MPHAQSGTAKQFGGRTGCCRLRGCSGQQRFCICPVTLDTLSLTHASELIWAWEIAFANGMFQKLASGMSMPELVSSWRRMDGVIGLWISRSAGCAAFLVTLPVKTSLTSMP